MNAVTHCDAPPEQPPQTKPAKAARPMTVRRQVKRMIVILLILYVALCAVLLGLADRILFQPQPGGYHDDKDILKLKTSDGAIISATYMTGLSATYTILFSHGNAEDLRDIFGELEQDYPHLKENILSAMGNLDPTRLLDPRFLDLEERHEPAALKHRSGVPDQFCVGFYGINLQYERIF